MGGWYEVDRRGLAEIAKRRGVAFIVTEPVQNAWDEKVSRVDVTLEPVPGKPLARLVVRDDSPDGFRDLRDSYALFRRSYKRENPEQRGRFNLGDKLLLAVAKEARITTTTGSVIFGPRGRRRSIRRTQRGSVLEATLRMTRKELGEALETVRRLLPPVPTAVNGELIREREPVLSFEASLETEVETGTGFTRTYRTAEVRIVEPADGEEPMLYEMGIPVCACGTPWHVDVQQKVPLSLDRSSVAPLYLSSLRRRVCEYVPELLPDEEAGAAWVMDALPYIDSDEAVRTLLLKRFGEKTVLADPSSPEATKRAIAAGWRVLHGGELRRSAWARMRTANVFRPAGEVFHTGRVPVSENGVEPTPEAGWSDEERRIAKWVREVVCTAADLPYVRVDICRGEGLPFSCAADGPYMIVNVGVAPWSHIASDLRQFGYVRDSMLADAYDVMVHEAAHVMGEKEHLTDEFERNMSAASARLILGGDLYSRKP